MTIWYGSWKGSHPGGEQGAPPQQAGLHVDHATPADCGWGCHSQISHLKDHVHQAGHGNDLTTVQAQLLVVVQHLMDTTMVLVECLL